MNKLEFKNKLKNYIRAMMPFMCIESEEESGCCDVIKQAVIETKKSGVEDPYDCYEWNMKDGLIQYVYDTEEQVWKLRKVATEGESKAKIPGASKGPDPLDAFDTFHTDRFNECVIIVKDFKNILGKDMVIRVIKNSIGRFKTVNVHVIFVGTVLEIPRELERDVTALEYPMPDEPALTTIIDRITDASIRTSSKYKDFAWENGNKETISQSMQGLTETQAEDALALSLIEANGDFNKEVGRLVFEEKVAQLKKLSFLRYQKVEKGFDNIGGFENVKLWVRGRKLGFTKRARERKVPYPKGVLFTGIPGCGKSELCRAIAHEMECPYFLVDVGASFGSKVGETEAHVRQFIRVVEAVGKCVVHLDEIEKCFNQGAVSGSGDSGTSSRSFATLLTWMADKKSPVFIAATSNDISRLPPELTRKGRFDEIFFVGLPMKSERKEIFRVVLSRYNIEACGLDAVAERTEKYTGAEIVAIVEDAMYQNLLDDSESFEQQLLRSVTKILPQAVSKSTEVENMRRSAEVNGFRNASEDWANTLTEKMRTSLEQSDKHSTRKIKLGAS